ncbi:Dipeptidyl aminopeptidase/acylaminoacyl peptidase [Mariniphaga anaerophila]|uniref:Dipeptidyl aminopeptidase/acylaminoacyl peptidase n=1 Tax=Mariniphaga anaerophila TaxID=1484053 RepID=A0A1M4WCE0_9BACT|nr:prolyl oligopeptidase family serine peptidase [Mariniphaga anaerophila]SHE78904.1 Dipeptidyl aminopeptidase/acylaminoacyl peptidase [Mariniphaga anaerophila]
MRRAALLLICFVSFGVFAQQPVKKPLAIEDFATWNTLPSAIISNNGKLIAFEQNLQKGDGLLILKRDKNGFDTIPRGSNPAFSPENNFMVFSIKQPEDTVRKAKLDKVKKDDMPKDSLGIWVFDNREVLKFPNFKSYKLPEENARWIAFTVELAPEQKDTVNTDSKKENKGENNLALFEVAGADTVLLRNVSEWFYAKKGDALYFSKELKDSTGTVSSLYAFDTFTGQVTSIFSEKGWLKKLVADETGSQVAFLFSQDTTETKQYSLYLGRQDGKPEKIVDAFTSGVPVSWAPSENGSVYFSEDGTKLFLGTAEQPKAEQKDTIPDDEKPKLDVWNWKDLKLQPQQNVEADREKKRTYLAVYHIGLNRFIQLADPGMRDISTLQKGNGELALGSNELPYLRAFSWTGKRNRDYYLVDLKSGIKREIAHEKSYLRLSPQGKYMVWWEPADSSYYARSTDINRLDAVSLTKILPVNFYYEQNDVPMEPFPYGIAGWSEDDRFLYAYDRYDIWKLDLSGERVPVNVTKAFGRRNETRLRYVKLDSEIEFIPAEKPVLLSALDERTMSGGFFSARFGEVAEPKLLVMDKNYFSGVKKAKDADRLIWTKEDVKTFPDLWSSDLKFSRPEKISDANPQQKKFIWPKVQMVEWTSFTGEKLKGLLYFPENLDPAKKYPMMVYFYERNAENLYRYSKPSPSRSIINKTFYASNGYVVFVPDITYKTGYPGQSAYDAIVSGTQYLVNTFPYINREKIGLQGQSWGGYQTAYLITQTDMYAAAMAGAPVSNMTSAYGGIRWQTGISRMFQYEHTQSRIGGTLWEKPMQYVENSPLFYAPKVNTPLLMMHNDNDGAVPWYQGIELFVALRRLDKPAWLLTYNGEPHNLKATSWANRIDLSKRMFQFFNHYLKGEPMPEWMEKGIPASEKGENLGY